MHVYKPSSSELGFFGFEVHALGVLVPCVGDFLQVVLLLFAFCIFLFC